MDSSNFGSAGNLVKDTLLQNAGLLQSLVEAASTAIVVTDPQGQCLYMNVAAENLTGFQLDEMMGRSIHETWHSRLPDGSLNPPERCPISQAMANVRSLNRHDGVFARKDGSFFSARTSTTPLVSRNTVVAFLHEIQDVSSEKPLDALAEETTFAEIPYDPSILVAAWDQSANLIFISPSYLEYTGLSRQQAMKAGLMERFHPDVREEALEAWRNAFTQKTSLTEEYEILNAEGQYHCFRMKMVPRFSRHGHYLGASATLTNVDDPKGAEGVLRVHEKHFRQIYDSGKIGVFFFDLHGNIKEANDTYLHMLGYSREEFENQGLNWQDISPQEFLTDEEISRLERGESIGPFEKQQCHQDGHRVDLLMYTTLFSEQQALGVAYVLDISPHTVIQSALQQSATEYQQLLESPLIGLLHCSSNGVILEANKAACKMLGYTEDEIATGTINWNSIIWAENKQESLDDIRELLSYREFKPREKTIIRKDGSRLSVLVGCTSHNSYTDRVICFMLDITNQKEVEGSLRENEARFRFMADHLPMLIWTSDKAGNVNFLNRTALDFIGTTKEQAYGNRWTETGIVHPDDVSKVWDSLQYAVRTQTPYTFEARIQHKQAGQYRWSLFHARPWFQTNGEFAGFIGSMTDIDELKLSELVHQESERHFRSIAESAPLMFWKSDAQGNVRFISKGWLEFTGLSEKQALGDGWLQSFSEEEQAQLREQFRQVMEAQTPITQEVELHDAAGYKKHVLLGITPSILKPFGQVLGYLGSMTDISICKETERKILEREEYFRSIVDATPVMLWISAPDGMNEFSSEGIKEYFGVSDQDLMGLKWLDFFHPDDREVLKQNFLSAVEHRNPYQIEVRALKKNGEYRWVLDAGRPHFDRQGNYLGYVGTMTDIHDRKLALLTLERSEEYFRQIVDASPVMLWISGVNLKNEFVSQGYADFLEMDREELLGDGWLRNLEPEDRKKMSEIVEEHLETLEPFSVEFKITKKSGEVRWALSYGQPRYSETGKLLGFIGTLVDITASKETEIRLRESEEYFRQIVDASPVMLWIINPKNEVQFVSQGLAKYFGLPRKDFLGKGWIRFLQPEDQELVPRIKEEHIKKEQPFHIEFKVIQNGKTRWVLDYGQPRYDEKGTLIGYIGTLIDITHSKEAALRLRESEEYFQDIIDASPVMLWISGPDGMINFISQGFIDYFGYSRDELMGVKWLDKVHPEDVTDYYKLYTQHVNQKEAYTAEFRFRNKNGDYIWVLEFAQPRFDPEGNFIGLIGTDSNITEKKEEELLLRESEARFQMMANIAPAMLWMTNEKDEAAFVSEGLKKFVKMDKDKEVAEWKSHWYSIFHPEDKEWFIPYREEHIKNREPYDAELRIRNGDDCRWVMTAGRPRFTDEGKFAGFVGSVTDIHNRKMAELKLQESEARFRMMADVAPVFIWTSDNKAEVQYFNKQLLDFLGMPQDSNELKNYIVKNVHPDDREALLAMAQNLIINPRAFKSDLRMYSPEYNGYRYIYSHGIPRYTPDGAFLGYVGASIDITDYKHAQEEISNYAKRLELSNRDLEEFATIASHDLQAPLRKITMFISYIEENAYHLLPAESKDYFDRIIKSVDKMQHLLDDLLNLSRIIRKGQPFKRVELNQVIDDVLSDLQFAITDAQGRVEVKALCTLDADALQMHQLFQNLIGNALKFHKPDVPPLMKIYQEPKQKDLCTIVVEDNGIGFTKEQAEHIFDPFVRLPGTEHFSGTGIGLAICRKIVERHGGTIDADGEPGVGARFTISLPVKHDEPASEPGKLPIE